MSTLITPGTIRATVIDTTDLSRNDLHKTTHAQVIEWKVMRNIDIITGVEVSSSEKQYAVEVFSNPVETELNFNFKISDPTTVSVVMLDASGKKIRSLVDNQLTLPGEHNYSFTRESLALASRSTYILTFSFEKTIITRKIVVN